MRNNPRFRTAILFTLLMILMTQTGYFSNVEFSEEQEIVKEQEIKFSVDTGTAVEIAVGDAHSCAISASGSVKCWGKGSDGQLGIGNVLDIGDEPDEMGVNLPFLDLGTGIIPTSLALGEEHTCALFDDSSIKCWGDVASLGLGYATSEDGFGDGYLETGDLLPSISLPSGTSATMIEAGGGHTCAVLDNDELICWGKNDYGQLGMGNTTFLGDDSSEVGNEFSTVELPPGRTVSQLALGKTHTCAIWDNGSVSCWGSNDNGELGIENTDDIGDDGGEMGINLGFISLPNGHNASNITAGDGFSCVILENSNTVCWGDNEFGQLGIENTNDIGDQNGEMGNLLGIINFGTSRYAVEIDAGSKSVCAILDNAQVKCWGQNDVGQLGLGDTLDRGDGFNEMGNSLLPVNIGGSADRIEVGDKFVLDKMIEEGSLLGGEPSGHIICLDAAPTGDAIIAALKFLESLEEYSFDVSSSIKDFHKMPQTLINLTVSNPNKVIVNDKFWSEVTKIENSLGQKGRVLIRPSGTEPLVRIMVESENKEQSEDYSNSLADLATRL